MEIHEVMNLIGSIGFPMAMCLAFWKYIMDSLKVHKEEIDGLKASLDKTTLVMTHICDKLDMKEGDEQ